MSLLKDLEQINHKISLPEAIDMTTRFRKEMATMLKPEYATIGVLPISETFNKSVFSALASQSGCVAIRSYLGMDKDKNVRLLFVGVNDKSEDILPDTQGGGGSIYEYGQRCPPACGVSALNPQV